jgi:hypothetical protein
MAARLAHDCGAFGVDGSAGLLKVKTRAVTRSLSDWPVRRGCSLLQWGSPLRPQQVAF